MSTKQLKDAIMDLIMRELPRERFSFDELGPKLEILLRFFYPPKVVKDKNAPKKTRTAYIFFCQKYRLETMERMKQESEQVKSVDVVRALAAKWKELKQWCDIADENALHEMNECKAQSMKDKERFLRENAAYIGKEQVC